MGAIDPTLPCPIPIDQLQGMIPQDGNPLWVIDVHQLRQILESTP
jgi:hypothetical protein